MMYKYSSKDISEAELRFFLFQIKCGVYYRNLWYNVDAECFKYHFVFITFS